MKQFLKLLLQRRLHLRAHRPLPTHEGVIMLLIRPMRVYRRRIPEEGPRGGRREGGGGSVWGRCGREAARQWAP